MRVQARIIADLMQSGSNLKNALTGAVAALVSSYFVAVLFAYLFRIPIPLAGYSGPFGQFRTYDMAVAELLKSVFVAWVFYGLLGGFIILPAGGLLTGVLVGRKYSGPKHRTTMIVLWSTAVSTVPVLVLSVLDYIIGPW